MSMCDFYGEKKIFKIYSHLSLLALSHCSPAGAGVGRARGQGGIHFPSFKPCYCQELLAGGQSSQPSPSPGAPIGLWQRRGFRRLMN